MRSACCQPGNACLRLEGLQAIISIISLTSMCKLVNGRTIAEVPQPMALTRFDQRFFASTRGRIIQLLRRGSRTVDELAEAVDLTDNGVRGHLATLERDGIVAQTGVR